MTTVRPYKSNQQVFEKRHEVLAEKIYCLLNEGSLFEIYRVLDTLKTKEDKKFVREVFKAKFDFNFQKYI